MAHKKGGMPGLSLLWKRALVISAAKGGSIKHRLPTSGRDQEMVTIPLKIENTLQFERIAAWRGFLSSFYWYSYSYALGTGTRLIQMKN